MILWQVQFEVCVQLVIVWCGWCGVDCCGFLVGLGFGWVDWQILVFVFVMQVVVVYWVVYQVGNVFIIFVVLEFLGNGYGKVLVVFGCDGCGDEVVGFFVGVVGEQVLVV